MDELIEDYLLLLMNKEHEKLDKILRDFVNTDIKNCEKQYQLISKYHESISKHIKCEEVHASDA